MAKQRFLQACRGQRVDFPPWVPYAGINCAYVIGARADRYLTDPILMAEGIARTAKLYQADAMPLAFDTSVEAEAVGCGLQWSANNTPFVVSHPLQGRSPGEAGIQLPSKTSGRYPVLFEAAARVKPQLADLDCALIGMITGPMTLSAQLAGVQVFSEMTRTPDTAARVFQFAGAAINRAVQFYLEMGCDVIAIVDPQASVMNANCFRNYITPNIKKTLADIRAASIRSLFFVCGDCSGILEEVCQSGADGIALDEQMNLLQVRDLARKYGLGFSGNLKLTTALCLDIISLREDTLICLAAGGLDGYILAPGCDLPYDTPAAKIDEIIAAREFFRQYYVNPSSAWSPPGI